MKKVKDGKIRDIYDLGDKTIYVYFDKIATSNIVFQKPFQTRERFQIS